MREPLKQSAEPETRVFVDLDRLLSDKVGFRFKGQIHYLNPIDTRTFFQVCNEMSALDSLAKKESVTVEALIKAYIKIFESVCDTINKDMVMQMTPPQCAALLQYVMDVVRGRTERTGSEEKKKPKLTGL